MMLFEKNNEENCSTSICDGRYIKKLIELHQQCLHAAFYLILVYFQRKK